MKKSIFSFAVIAIAAMSTVVLSSCDKNDDGYGQSAKPMVQTSTSTSASSSTGSSTSSSASKLYNYHGNSFFVCDDLVQVGTFKVQVSDGTKTSEYDLVAQGKHCTKTIEVYDEKISATGYLLEVVLPSKDDLKCTVTFVPNEKAQTYDTSKAFDAIYETGYGKGTSTSINFSCDSHANKGISGKNLVTYCERIASCMSD